MFGAALASGCIKKGHPMPGIGDNIAQLVRNRRQREVAMGAAPAGSPGLPGLVELRGFGSNPGDLRMSAHVPAVLPPEAPLVVALHGCTQTAAGYDAGAGWSRMAERHGFAVLLPEQVRGNNPNTCFNWFQPADTARGGGEAESIRQGIAHMVATHRLNPARVFITGLSAGGAMAAAMLAAYPEVFAGGAIIAGLPYGSAHSMPQAFEAMGGRRIHAPREWGNLVRQASPHSGPWPRVQVWQGDADSTVRPGNATELVKQWADVLGLPSAPDVVDRVDGAAHQAWRDAAGQVVLEAFMVPGMGHGTPLNPGAADLDQSMGTPAPYMLDAGISSTWHMARSWGLLTAAAETRTEAARAQQGTAQAEARPAFADLLGGLLPEIKLPAAARTGGVGGVIEKALRSAGLMKG
jgi:poly(hydroxyalkanoate) depolymerase family esterase